MKKFLIKNVFDKNGKYEVITVADDAKEIHFDKYVVPIDNIENVLDPVVITHQCKFEVGETKEDAQNNNMLIEFPSVKIILELLPNDFNGIDEEEFIKQQIETLDDELIVSQSAIRSIIESALDGIFGAKGMTLN